MHNFTRREWLVAAACWTEVLRGQDFRGVDATTAGEIEALAETILPGAGEAGVIRFIDGALAGYDQDRRADYQKGMAEVQARRAALFPGSKNIAGLSEEERVRLVTDIEKSDFFGLVRRHTILGFFGHPRHGGNRNGASAKLLGVQETMMYSPPFGYYDREVAK
jgi:gluconate 2-dehydrogenase gamma chain